MSIAIYILYICVYLSMYLSSLLLREKKKEKLSIYNEKYDHFVYQLLISVTDCCRQTLHIKADYYQKDGSWSIK